MNISGYNFEGPYDPYRGFTNTIAAVYTIIDAEPRLLDVGQTEDLNNRFPNHPRQSQWEACKTGNIHLYILRVTGEQMRLGIESTIRTSYHPQCGDR